MVNSRDVPNGVLAAVVLAATHLAGCSPPPDAAPQLTYTRDIAPILFEHCAGCHRPGQVAPFSVLEYASVRAHAVQIVAATSRRAMPPWPPEEGYGEFRNARRLQQDQIATIRRWVEQGAAEGDSRDLPPVPTWTGDWQLGAPHLVVTLAEPYTLAAGRTDVFRNFVIPVELPSSRYVRGMEFRPGNARVVHHATLLVDPARASRKLDAADPIPGYEGMLGFAPGVHVPDGHLLGWTPGRAPSLEDADKAWRLEPGSDLVVQLHMLPQPTPQTVNPVIGLYFSETPPEDTLLPVRFKLGSNTIDIPAGARNHTVTDSYVLPVDVEVLSVNPHAHYLAKDIKAFATLPDGTRRWLIWIKNWNFNWQDVYQYITPVALPRGATLTMEFVYDNSADNPRYRNEQPQRVTYGPRSRDEMGDLWLQLAPRTKDARAVLVRASHDRTAAEAVREAQRRLLAAPDAERHNLLAVRYIEAGKLAEAEAELREALRLRPGYVQARGNLGTVLNAQGRREEAVENLREALMLDPDNVDLHVGLGTVLNVAGRFSQAIPHFEQALASGQDSAETRNNLAVALGSLGRIDDAIRHFRRAVQMKPDYADAHANLGIALDATGARDDAIRHLREALRIQPDHRDARKHLSRLTRAR